MNGTLKTIITLVFSGSILIGALLLAVDYWKLKQKVDSTVVPPPEVKQRLDRLEHDMRSHKH